MNEEVFQLYKNLDPSRRSNIQNIFQDSPKTLRFIDFLDACKGPFKTPKVVNFIYQEERADTSQSILINRYYKLRQSLKEWLLSQLKHSSVCFTSEEQELAFSRLLVIKNQHQYALDRLEPLEKKCWDYNLFEILPDVLQLMVRAAESQFGGHSKQKKTYRERLYLANQLQQLLQSMQYRFRGIYGSPGDYNSIIASIRREVKRHKEYPRFTMLYHYIAFSTGVFLPEVATKARNALSRHINQYEKLCEKHPNIPILYFEPYHREKFEIDFYFRKAMFFHSKGDFKKAFKESKQHRQLTKQYTFLHPPKSENRYRNLVYIALSAAEYDTVEELLKELEAFYEEQDRPRPYHQLSMEWMSLYNHAFPFKRCPDKLQLQKEVDDYIGELAKKMSENQYIWVLSVKLDFHIIHLEIKEAKELMTKESLRELHQKFNTWEDLQTLVAVLENRDLAGLKALQKRIKKMLAAEPKLSITKGLHCNWILQLIEHFASRFNNL